MIKQKIRDKLDNLGDKLDKRTVKIITPYALVTGFVALTSTIITLTIGPETPLILGAISLAIWRAGKQRQEQQKINAQILEVEKGLSPPQPLGPTPKKDEMQKL